MIAHIVLFKFNDKNKDENIKKAKEMLLALEDKIEVLEHIEVGVNFDDAERAMDMSIYTLFDTKENLQTYASHPAHLEVVEFIKSVTEYSKVCDYSI